MFRLDRLLSEIAGSSTSFDTEDSLDCPVRSMAYTQSHQVANTSRFAFTDPHQSPISRPWYKTMLAYRLHRPTDDERGTKYAREMTPLATISDHLEDV